MASEALFVARKVRPSNRGFADRPKFSGSKDRQQEWSTPKTKDKRKKIKVKQLSGFNALAAK